MHDDQRVWYVLYSKAHKEEQAQFHLRLKGIETFFPRLQLPGASDDRRRIVPLFPNYLFVRVDLNREYQYVLWSPGVKRLVTFGDTPVPLDECVVDFLRQEADSQGVIKARSQLRRGQAVEIRGGPFDGLLGIIEDPPDDRGRVKVLLKLLSRQVSVKLRVEFIRGSQLTYSPAAAANIGLNLVSARG
ncbi:MAG TPA: transcription termination/antitermination NusG family protein [Candidatus Acidoferrales bacterium]|nr:transcription termination/antitermination NusG family protein [Candidatus Acidoferrales bacterium]